MNIQENAIPDDAAMLPQMSDWDRLLHAKSKKEEVVMNEATAGQPSTSQVRQQGKNVVLASHHMMARPNETQFQKIDVVMKPGHKRVKSDVPVSTKVIASAAN